MSLSTEFAPVVTSLQSQLASLTSVIATETNTQKFLQESRSIEYAYASLQQISASQALLTASDSSVSASATAGLSHASEVLSSLSKADNIYGMDPSLGGNVAMTIIMGIFFIAHTGMGWFYQTWWFGISYFLGSALEMIGYIGRSVSAGDSDNKDAYMVQIVCLTIAPCFIMAGIYFLLAQFVMVYGQKYAILKPIWYSYIFIACDIVSLLVQGTGGGIASAAAKRYESGQTGTDIMVGGLAFQVVSMSVFLLMYGHFFWKIKYLRSGFKEMENQFPEEFASIRAKPSFKWFPLVVFLGTIFVYVRSIYRVVELSEGWKGYLMIHEIYFMILDALMMALTCLIFIPFHPGIMIGKGFYCCTWY
ncbi:Sphingoid long-chain base transporter RSB1 [Cyberlindnera fabianii]|uniref:Sphingoid long-chain base transporter RSB1 n=1 Tax=Cyberlindnera fabianii TaxID=36022 RepID=A0A1V2L0L9_CYBFA|nr:Sphingoid long-chain base transporter RSB1 [Cyberlindnera fabianii]